MQNQQKMSAKSNFSRALRTTLGLTAIIWGIHIFQYVTRIDLGTLGIYPRETFGLKGILFSPFIHANWGHLLSNTPPLMVLTGLLFFFYRKFAWSVFVTLYLLTGLAVWLLARESFHIGASGLIYALVSFIFWTGLFRRNVKSIILALLVGMVYGSMFLGIVPNQAPNISWESHLLGGVMGIVVAYLYRHQTEEDEAPKVYDYETEEHTPEHFLDRDTFDKTKREREIEDRFNRWEQSDTWL